MTDEFTKRFTHDFKKITMFLDKIQASRDSMSAVAAE